jgi:hypothetical protein
MTQDDSRSLDDAFDGLVDALAEATRSLRAHPSFADADHRVNGYRFVLAMLLARLEEDVIFDPDFPNLRSVDVRIREAGDNPDQRYWTSRLRGGETYRIWGNVGTARRVDVQVYAGVPAQPGGGRSASFLDFESIDVAPDGSFEVIASPERVDGNWIECPADATRLFVRQVFSDWDRELPGEVHLDRVGAEGEPRPVVTEDELAERLRSASANLTHRVALWPEMVRTRYLIYTVNTLSPLYDPGSVGGVHGRWMAHGSYDLAPDEALVVRLWPAPGNYVGIQLTDLWFSSLEYANRQTSLSGDQTVTSDDGTSWYVVSAADPGVPNWLDTMGTRRGCILVRYDGTQGVLPAGDGHPAAQVVPLRMLRDVLPATTPTTTPDQRRAVLAARRRHVQRRFGF